MNWLTSRCAPLVAVAALAALTGCDKGTDLNVDLPETTAVNTSYKDIQLEVATVRLSPIQTLKADHFMVGRLADNVAGTTTAGFYSNVLDASGVNTIVTASGGVPTDSLPAGLPNVRLDSVVLVAGFDRVYGSTAAPVRFDVFKLTAPLDERQAGYDSSNPVALDPTPLGQNLTSRLDRTQVQVVTAAVAATSTTAGTPAVTATVPDPTVRLLLQRTAVPASGTRPAVSGVASPFATDLFADLNTPGFSQARLDAKLKGIAVLPNANHTGSLVSFTKGYKSRMVVYYHAADTLKRVYSIYFGPTYSGMGLTSSRDPRYYTTISNVLPPPLAALAAPSGAVSAAALSGTSYAQEGTGLSPRITLQPRITLKYLTQSDDTSGVVINRAELLVPIKPYTNVLYTNPAQLYAVEVDANNAILQRTVNFLSVDRVVQADGQNPVGTGYPATGPLANATGQSSYTIPITSFLQNYFYSAPATKAKYLVLTPNIRTQSNLSLNRAALDANNIRLRVYYSRQR
ncbi:DUF4270 family protein [Hymenobacter properus]|uniref:DUF4270 family protein n=1 Tax=Hymenobacter properus TaxID=2791026 RepID=A0A931FLJ0_9BACT|nr:DUF4270 family protein [Hymenobacter properus]MBF9142920.1 DUF4270 family protein [Hymenobacter properus]MBR7721727.1 DUF4270 family protein [Microvirga sp. SRT04]